jgi:hypothetical protein
MRRQVDHPAVQPPCTCHEEDRPAGPCPRKYAASECRAAARARREQGR